MDMAAPAAVDVDDASPVRWRYPRKHAGARGWPLGPPHPTVGLLPLSGSLGVLSCPRGLWAGLPATVRFSA